MKACVFVPGVVAVVMGLYLTAIVPELWVSSDLPIAVGWIALSGGCIVSRGLRARVAAGTLPRDAAIRRFTPFVAFFPLVIALASVVGLAISDEMGVSRGHMTGLQPMVFGGDGFILAVMVFAAHVLLMPRTRS